MKGTHMNRNSKQDHLSTLIAQGGMKAAMAVLFAFLLFLFFHGFSVVDQADYLSSWVGRKAQYLAVFLAFSFVCMLFFLVRNFLQKFSARTLKILTAVLFGVMILIQVFFLIYFRSMYLWDGAFVVGGANSLVTEGSIGQDAYYYLSVYKNQHPFVVFTALLLWIGQRLSLETAGQYLLLNMVNTICLDTAVFFLLKCQDYVLRHREDHERAQRRCYLLMLIAGNPFVYVFAAYYYTIVLSLPFFVAGMYFALKVLCGDSVEKSNRRFQKYVIDVLPAGILFAVGYALRATTIIPVIACLLTGFVIVLLKRDAKSVLQPVLLFGVVILTGSLISLGAQRIVGIDTTDTAFPTSHWLMMSLTSPGSHNEEDEAFTAGFATKEEKKQAVHERLVGKLKDLGIGGLAHLAVDKLEYTWESGNHSYGFFTGNTLRVRGPYEWIYGGHKDLLALYGQGYYLFLIGAALLAILRLFVKIPSGEERTIVCPVFFFCLTLLGGLLFYLLWETGTQHSLVFFPIFFWIASFSAYVRPVYTGKTKELYERFHRPVLMGVGAFTFLLLTVFMIKERAVFTTRVYENSAVVSLQQLANHPYELKDDEVFVQQISADHSFDRMIFQFRNFVSDEENDSGYRVRFYRGELLWEDTIIAKGQPLNGAFIKDFETLPAGSYELEITKTEGSRDNHLSIVTYRMDGYDAYTDGELLINGQSDARDLMFGLYEKRNGCYVSVPGYVCFWLVFFICFLFWEICCILMDKYGKKE